MKLNALTWSMKNTESLRISRERILLETMASILPKVNKVIADKEVGGNVLPFLPLGQTMEQLNK